MKTGGSPPRTHRPARPRGRPRTGEPLHPALAEFLEAVGHMAGDAVLANYREQKELAPASISSPGGNNSSPGTPGEGETGEAFVADSSGVQSSVKGIHRGR